jgi:hypothetical protein
MINESADAVVASEKAVFCFEILMNSNGGQPLIQLRGDHFPVLFAETLWTSASRETRKDDWRISAGLRHERVWLVLNLVSRFFFRRTGAQVWPVLSLLGARLTVHWSSLGRSQPLHIFVDRSSINAQYSSNFPVRMTGAVQCFDRLNAGHGQLIGHTKLSQHFRAEIAQHNQSLQWPVLTRTCVAGFDRAMTNTHDCQSLQVVLV